MRVLLTRECFRSVVFRNVVASSSACKSTCYHQEMAPRGTIYDIDTEPSENLAVAVGQVFLIEFGTLSLVDYDYQNTVCT